VVRDGQIEPEQAYDGADQALCLAQSQPEHCPERQPCQDGQRRVVPLSTPGRPWFSRPRRDRLLGHPNRQAAALAQAGVIRRPVRDLERLLGDVVASVGVQLEGQDGIQGQTGTTLLPRPGLGRHQADPCNNASAAEFVSNEGVAAVKLDHRCRKPSLRPRPKAEKLHMR